MFSSIIIAVFVFFTYMQYAHYETWANNELWYFHSDGYVVECEFRLFQSPGMCNAFDEHGNIVDTKTGMGNWKNENIEPEYESKNISGQLKGIFGNCACQERVKSNPDTMERCIQPELTWENSTHYINNNICEWREKEETFTWISLPITSCGYPWHESNYEKTKQYSVEYRNIFGNYDSSDPLESAEAMHYVITRYYEDIGKDILDVKTTVDHSMPRTGEGCHTTVGGTWHLKIQNSDLEYFLDNEYVELEIKK